MKSSGFKIEYVILGVAIISLLLYLFLRNPDRVHYDIPEIDPVSSEDIHKVEITRAGKTITLEIKDKQWFIGPQGYPANPDKIQKIIKEISGFSITDVISESGSYSKYGLDDQNGIITRVYDQEGLIWEFKIGKQAATYRHTYVKIQNDDRVFHAKNAFRTQFDQTVDALRDKQVMKFDPSEIREIELNRAGESLVFSRQMKKVEIKAQPPATSEATAKKEPAENKEVEIWVMPYGKKGKTEEIKTMIRDLSDLSCLKFVEGKTKLEFTDPIYSITSKGNKQYTLQIFSKIQEGDDSYPAATSVNSYPFFLSSYKAEALMKKPEDLIQTGKE